MELLDSIGPLTAARREAFGLAAQTALVEVERGKKRVSRLALLRLLAFLALVVGAIYLFAEGLWPWAIGLLALGLAGFNQLVGRQDAAQQALSVEEATVAAAEREMALQAYDFSDQDGGIDFANPAHPYTGDLDIFGARSVFGQLNVTASLVGRHALARYLQQVLAKAEHTNERQHALRELMPLLDWRLRFQALGRVEVGRDGGLVALDRLRAWTRTPAEFQENWWPAVFWGLSLFNLAWLASFAYLPFAVALLGYAPTIVLLYRCKIRVDLIQAQTEEAVAQLSRNAALLGAIESQNWTSPLLQSLHARLTGAGGVSSGILVGQLALDARQLAIRVNPFVLLLNVFSLWEIRYARRLEAWKVARQQVLGGGAEFPLAAAFKLPTASLGMETSGVPRPTAGPHLADSVLDEWLRSLGAFDALASLAAAADRWPDWTFPEVLAGDEGVLPHSTTLRAGSLREGASIHGEGMRHPLIVPARSVPNNFDSPVHEHVTLLTGSNMAGKSTLLRTIGLQLVLAQAGSAVPSRRLTITPVRVYTSMRTQDDLHEGASAFYAELQRLRLVVDATRDGMEVPVFFLLDEILKGTNSDDRNTGGRALIRQLLSLGGAGVVATHDLGLGELTQETNAVSTLRLEVETDAAGDLYFDYTVKPGLAQSRNASALMRRLGLGIEK